MEVEVEVEMEIEVEVEVEVEVEDKNGYYKQGKDDDKIVYVSMDVLSYSLHIQFFSQH